MTKANNQHWFEGYFAQRSPEAAPRTNGDALIEHTRKQAEVVLNCLDSLRGLWRLEACPDPSAHDEAEAAAGTALDEERLRQAMKNTTAHLSSDWTHPDRAEAIAAEYARLAAASEPAGGGEG